MEHKTLSVELRTLTGKGPSRRYRSEGKIPAVIYGVKENKSITLDSREFSRKFKRISENTLITLDFGKEKHEVLIKDYQENIIKETIEHIDFLEIEKGKLLKTNVPVTLTGNAAGVKEGGILVQKIKEVEVECLPKDIPENFTLSLDGLELGSSLHISDIEVVKGVSILVSADATVVVVNRPKAAVEETEEETEEVAETTEEA